MMKVGNKLYTSLYGLSKVEAGTRLQRDSDGQDAPSVRRQSFAEIRAKAEEIRKESGFQKNIDPRIAIALTAANSDKLFSLKRGEKPAAKDIVHDHSYNRGKTTNIEV